LFFDISNVGRRGGASRFARAVRRGRFGRAAEFFLSPPHTNGTTYNANSAVTKTTDGLSKDTNFGIDILGRTYKTTDATSKITQEIFNADDQVTGSIDGDNHLTADGIDGDGETTSVKDGLGNLRKNVYDTDGRLLSFTDPVGNTTNYGYDKHSTPPGQSGPSASVS
jgi:uncharacterized protein RhaS with RHS repeats